MDSIYDWAVRWRIPPEAIADLQRQMGVTHQVPAPGATSEAGAQQRIQLAAAYEGWHLWRNNVGACVDEHGNHVRYGLCNESKAVNEKCKSSDLIGMRQVHIKPHHVGQVLGQIVALEVKKPGWKYKATAHERAQRNFIELVNANGGYAKFTTGEL